jgi:hypothetical protein
MYTPTLEVDEFEATAALPIGIDIIGIGKISDKK